MPQVNSSFAASGETLVHNHECELILPGDNYIHAHQIVGEVVPQDDYEYKQKYQDTAQQVVCTVYVITEWNGTKYCDFKYSDFNNVDCYWLEGDSARLSECDFSGPSGVWVNITNLPKCKKFLYMPTEFSAKEYTANEFLPYTTYACRFLPPRTAKSGYFIAGGEIPGVPMRWEFTNTYTGNKTIPEGYDGYVSSSPENNGYTWPIGSDVIYCDTVDVNNCIPTTSYLGGQSYTFNEFNYRTINNIYVKNGYLNPNDLGNSYVSSYISGSSANWWFDKINFGNDLTASLIGVSGYENQPYGTGGSLPYYPYTANGCHIESGFAPV